MISSGTEAYRLGREYRVMPIAMDPAHCVDVAAGPVTIVLESRQLTARHVIEHARQRGQLDEIDDVGGLDDSGPSLHVLAADDRVEHLRFDCFEHEPHYHYIDDDEQTNVVVRIDEAAEGDPLEWALSALGHRLPEMLTRAGAPSLADRVAADYGAVRAGLDEVRRRLEDAHAEPVAGTDRVDDRAGGLAAWEPSITPPIGVTLTDEQRLACLFRILAADGFAENLAGHITWQRPGDDAMLVNPWGLWWSELSAGDICAVAGDGQVLAGRWDVTPAIHIHTELHRRRPDARVVVHNHPYHVTVLAALGVLPGLFHQTGSMFLDDLVFVEEYGGEIDTPLLGAALAEQIGDATTAVLANHGVIITGETPELALYRAASVDRVCRLSYDLLLAGRQPHEMPRSAMVGMKASLLERGAPVYFAGAVRQLLADQPDVLD